MTLDKKLRHTTLAATLLLFAACENDELPQPAPQPGGSAIAFTVDAKVAATRSLPENPQTDPDATSPAVQHVSAVRLYIFRHGDDGNTYYAGCDDITNDEWADLPVSEGKEGETVTKTYTMTTRMLSFTEYTLLGVGYEATDATDTQKLLDAYEEKYNNQLLSSLSMDNIITSQADPSTGSLTDGDVVDLSAIVTTLATGNGNDEDNDKDRIAHNEYFTGTFRAMTNGSGRLTYAKVEMRRRVAGLSASFKLQNFAEEPAGVAIMLYQAQNKSVPTLPRNWQAPFFEDYKDDPLTGNNTQTGLAAVKANPQCILFVPTKPTDNNENAGDGTTTAADGESSTAGGQGEVTTEEGAAYLLPIPAPAYDAEKNYTLAVVVYDKDGKAICTKRAALNIGTGGQAELIFATDLGTGIVDDESYYRYPIVANRFYRFGTTATPLEVKFDPSNPFEVEVEEGWEGQPDLDFRD